MGNRQEGKNCVFLNSSSQAWSTDRPTNMGTDELALVLFCGSPGALPSFLDIAPFLSHSANAFYVYLSHVSKTKPSMLGEILKFRLTHPVHEIQAGMKFKKGAIYIPPANKDVTFKSKRFGLQDSVTRFTPDLDTAIQSASGAFKSQLIVTLLSGKLREGIESLSNVFKNGGKAFIQGGQNNSYFESMSEESLKIGAPRLSLPSGELAAKINKLTLTNR